MADLTRDQAGCLHARLLDAVVGRSGTVYKRWLDTQPALVAGVETAALDPFRGYANAIRDGLPDAVAVLDAFHVVRVRHEALCVRAGVRDPCRSAVAAAGLKLRAA